MSGTAERIASADQYLNSRTGNYAYRCERYDAALEAMHGLGLDDSCTVLDLGAGAHEFGVRLHTGRVLGVRADVGTAAEGRITLAPDDVALVYDIPPSRARYWGVDAALDGTDLEKWLPVRRVEFCVALEVLEHLRAPGRLLRQMVRCATRGVVVSTPNPRTVDVLAIDHTHQTCVSSTLLEREGFQVEEASFYGADADSLFGVWSPLFVR